MQLICVFVFAYAKSQFSHNEAQLKHCFCFIFQFSFVLNSKKEKIRHLKRQGEFSLKYYHVSSVFDVNSFLQFTIKLFEPRREKTGFLHMQKQRHRSASR